jgi:hypothetical protein
MKRTLIILLAAAGLVGCETEGPSGPAPSGPAYAPPAHGGEAFRDSDFAWSQQSGGDSIDGVLAYKAGHYTCQGGSVVLAPETAWSRARMRVLYLSTSGAAMPVDDVQARTPPEHGAEYAKYARRATCDASNHFSFANLPDGAWYVITVATPTAGGQKVAVMKRVETHGGVRHVTLQ